MSKQLNGRKYMNTNYNVIRILAASNPLKEHTVKGKLWKFILTILYLSKVVYLLTLLSNIFFYSHDIQSWSKSAAVSFFSIASIATELIVTFRLDSILQAIDDFNTEFETLEQMFSIPEELSILRADEWNTKFVISIIASSSTGALLLPVADYFENCQGPDYVLDIHKPYPCSRIWFPFDVSAHTVAITVLLWECIVSVLIALNVYGISGVIVSMANHVQLKLKILQHFLKNINKEIELSRTKNCHTTLKESQGSLQRLKYNRLQLCIKYHQKILWYCSRMAIFVAPLLLIVVLVSLMGLCLGAFQVAVSDLDGATFNTFAFAVTIIGAFVVLNCWACSQITKESSAIVQAAYESEWYDCSHEHKMALLLLMIRANKPITMSVGGISSINMGTALNVFRAAYSYLSVLMQMSNTR